MIIKSSSTLPLPYLTLPYYYYTLLLLPPSRFIIIISMLFFFFFFFFFLFFIFIFLSLVAFPYEDHAADNQFSLLSAKCVFSHEEFGVENKYPSIYIMNK